MPGAVAGPVGHESVPDLSLTGRWHLGGECSKGSPPKGAAPRNPEDQATATPGSTAHHKPSAVPWSDREQEDFGYSGAQAS